MKPKIKEVYEYCEMEKYINEKYNVYIDDFAGKFHLPGNKKAPDWFFEWTKKNHGIKTKKELGQLQIDNNKLYKSLHDEYMNNHQKNEPPYQNFWHFMGDTFEINNNSSLSINFSDLKELADEDWQKQIIDMFIAEVGDKTINVEFNW